MSIDTSQFLQTFYEESFEGLDVMESSLLTLSDGDSDDPDLLNGIFRAAHSIKGGSGTFGLTAISGFTHLVETLLDEMRNGTRPPARETVDLLLQSVDCIRELLVHCREGGDEAPECSQDLEGRLRQLLEQQDGGAVSAAPAAPASASGTQNGGWQIHFRPHPNFFLTGNEPVRILRELDGLGELEVEADTAALPAFADIDPEQSYLAWTLKLQGDIPRATLDDVFAWVDGECELVIEPLQGPGEGAADADEGVAGELMLERRRGGDRRRGADRRAPGAGMEGSSIRVNIDKVDSVINLVGELVITQSMLSTLGEDFDMSRLQRLHDGLAQLERNTRELQDQVMRMRMLPIGFVFNRFPRMVHDLSSSLGKEVELEISGESTEVDKTVVEHIGDPLVHLVRNALDHGIELPEERSSAGKEARGRLSLNAFHKGGNIVIEIRDDGRGLNAERIRAKAIERGLILDDVELAPEQIHELIFMPGFSTAQEVSDVSGRGVGMDVVRRNIQGLGGSIEIASEFGKGSAFTIRLPLTLAILDGQTVAVGEENYIIPLISIIESIQVRPGSINQVAGRGETFAWREDYLPVIRLDSLFGGQSRCGDISEGLLVVVEGEGRRVALLVDDLLGQQQVVVKSLETNFRRVEGISGATILGDGSVALIVDIAGVIRNARTSEQESTAYGYRQRA